jgi:DNA-binding NtrC family response regulator
MIPFPVLGKTPVSRAIVPTRVLVIDSEPLIRWSICAALAAEGFDAVAASDAVEAARLATEWPPPRVVLLDLRKPDADAADLLQCRAVYPECRFLIMTTEPGATGLDAARSKGIEVIQKPFDLARIVASVTRLAEREPHGLEG